MLNEFHKKMLDYTAIKAFNHNSNGKQKIFAVALDKRKRIIAEAGNSYIKSHPLQGHYANNVNAPKKIFLHAEILLLAKLAKVKQECKTIYIARVNNSGEVRLARPCEICFPAIEEATIEEIYWTNHGY